MITCPECGLQAPDDAKFCDRCGQGLTATGAPAQVLSTRPTPLAPGTIIRGYEIVELLIVELTSQDSVENRYRAIRKADGPEKRKKRSPCASASHRRASIRKKSPPKRQSPRRRLLLPRSILTRRLPSSSLRRR